MDKRYKLNYCYRYIDKDKNYVLDSLKIKDRISDTKIVIHNKFSNRYSIDLYDDNEIIDNYTKTSSEDISIMNMNYRELYYYNDKPLIITKDTNIENKIVYDSLDWEYKLLIDNKIISFNFQYNQTIVHYQKKQIILVYSPDLESSSSFSMFNKIDYPDEIIKYDNDIIFTFNNISNKGIMINLKTNESYEFNTYPKLDGFIELEPNLKQPEILEIYNIEKDSITPNIFYKHLPFDEIIEIKFDKENYLSYKFVPSITKTKNKSLPYVYYEIETNILYY